MSSVRARSHDGTTLASVSSRGGKAETISLSDFTRTPLFDARKGPSKPAHVALDSAWNHLALGRGLELCVWDTRAGVQLWSADLLPYDAKQPVGTTARIEPVRA